MKQSPVVENWLNPDCYPLEQSDKDRIVNMNLMQMLLQANEWDRNCRHNIAEGIGENVSMIFDKIVSEPAVIVAAGPSYYRTDEIVTKYDRAKIFCVDRALDKLQAEGFIPDYVVCRDCTPKVAEYIKNIHEDTIAIISLMCDPTVFQTAIHCKQIYWYGPVDPFNPVFNCWYEDYGKEIATVKEGGLVSFAAVDLAVNMGHNPIVLVGNDLAYDTLKEANECAEKGELLIPLSDGRWTKDSFMSPIGCFVNEALFYPDVEFINASNNAPEMSIKGWSLI